MKIAAGQATKRERERERQIEESQHHAGVYRSELRP